ncbi:hypothetical protein KVT40_004615 [Elsinoe batatas]|uniref:Methyltransferase type 11 domain-containing protein n=1 Tax=Elsinoe batatas TaxID=2601811 RepID=A0A8K0L125_9PEZI|nr:hypothetical protein KVT40_004615 [Elsinoe batatas]
MERSRPRKPRSPRSHRGKLAAESKPSGLVPAPLVAKSKSQSALGPAIHLPASRSARPTHEPSYPQSMDQILQSHPQTMTIDPSMVVSSRPPRSTTAPPQETLHQQQRSLRQTESSEIPSVPRLRRKRSMIGKERRDSTSRIDHLQPMLQDKVLTDQQSLRPVSTQPPVTPVQDDLPPSQNLSPPKQLHPALRQQENRLSATPFSYAPSTTPSSRYTASPAFSQVSSRTSISSYSPNMPSGVFGTLPADRKDDRRGPGLPSSPKAFKDAAKRVSRPTSSDMRAQPTIPPEFAHLNVDVQRPASTRSRPRRPSRDGTPDLTIESRAIPVIQSDLSPRPGSGERFTSPISPSSESRRRFFGSWSRSSSRDSSHRKDSGVYPFSPVADPKKNDGRETPQSVLTAPSPANEDISRPGSASRFGRLLGRSTENASKLQKAPRRGPAAGTGHEGYGRFGFRGRNFSFSSLKSAGRSSSVDSTASRVSDQHEGDYGSDVSESETEATQSRRYGNTSVVSARPATPLDKEALVQSGLLGKKHMKATERRSFAQRAKDASAPIDMLNQFESTSYIGADKPMAGKNKPARPSSRRLSFGSASKPAPDVSDHVKPKPSRRWNFFQRAQAKNRDTASSPRLSQDASQDIGKLGFYANDAQESPVDLLEAHVLAEDPQVRPTRSEVSRVDPGTNQVVPYDARHSSLLPPPPSQKLREAITQNRSSQGRPPSFRLDSTESPEILHATTAHPAHPQMISNAAPRSARSSLAHRPMPGNVFALGIHNMQSPTQNMSTVDASSSEDQFIAFPPRKNSELSYTSSSGAASFRSSSTLVANAQPSTWLGDEDVWNEYNELIDEVLPTKTPQLARNPKTPPSTSSSLSAPFQYDDTRGLVRPESKFLPQIHALIEDLEAPVIPADRPQSDSPDRFSQYLQPAATPSTPYSLSDIMAGYGERTASYASTKGRNSGYGDPRQSMESGYSSHYSRMSGPSRPISKPDFGESISPVMEESEPPSAIDETSSRKSRRSADADLRFGALMTSKWLSFGRVLFSPAHNEVRNGEDVRVLVVDGLGKDWSYYCALTYPNATFYNLEITTTDAKSSTRGQDLTNYRNVRHFSIGSPFPFPRGFFTAVIFRFPVATTDKALHACVFECKRVLRPGGFLELSVLDLDMMNMGTKARRALRSLKMDMHTHNDQISLRNLGDTMVTMVGRRGFDNIQRCIVGIPVAGRIPRSQDMSSDSSGRSSLQAAISAHEKGGKRQTKDFAGILYSQQSSSPTKARDNDEGITKMVAKVGRWWYSTCYGTVAGSEDAMWEQSGLLRECEKQGTAFRLLLCYAQKPTCPPRRTASV